MDPALSIAYMTYPWHAVEQVLPVCRANAAIHQAICLSACPSIKALGHDVNVTLQEQPEEVGRQCQLASRSRSQVEWLCASQIVTPPPHPAAAAKCDAFQVHCKHMVVCQMIGMVVANLSTGKAGNCCRHWPSRGFIERDTKLNLASYAGHMQ